MSKNKGSHSPHTLAGAAFTELLRAVFLVNGRLIAEGDRLTRDFGFTSARWQVLGAAGDAPRTVPQLARQMGLSRQSVQRLVDWLADGGFVRLIENPDHRRAKLVELTDKGVRTRANLQARQVFWANDIGRTFSQQELDEARDVLLRLRLALSRPRKTAARRSRG